MARRKTSAQQSSMFKREIPEMPEGYYSPGPNPNLRRFIEEHITLYDSETDDYSEGAFDKSVVISNRRDPINDLHIYWSKKPYAAIQQYIAHYTTKDDIVLDPFCGSGTTAFAALLEDRIIIAIDLSPASTFITKNYCTPRNPDEVQRAFQELKELTKKEMDWLYETRCDLCDGHAVIASMVHSTVFQCSRCLESIPFFDCIEAKGQTATGRPKKIQVCPKCYARGYMEEINVGRNRKLGIIPVATSYQCSEGCKPRRHTRTHNDTEPKKQKYFHQYDVAKLTEIKEEQIPYWYPTTRMLNTTEDQKVWGLLWRPYHGQIARVDQFFTKRSLRALSLTLESIARVQVGQDALRFAFSGALFNATKMYRYREKGGGPQPGNYYMPPVFREIRVWTLLEQKIKNLVKADRIWQTLPSSLDLCISTQSATDLWNIPTNSVDYVFTDPPYAEKVQYGELNFLWEAWLGFDTRWIDDEIIINNVRGKSDTEWMQKLRKALCECYRVLKPGRWLSLCYHDSSEGTWHLVQDMMTEIGFIPESVENTLYIDTGQKSYHQLMDRKITKRDLVINFRKPRLNELVTQLTLSLDEDPVTFREKAHAILLEALDAHPGSPVDRLYDELVSRMVRRGEFERHNFDELLQGVAEESPPGSGRWYLLETADQVDEAESSKEAAAAARLEAFMQGYMEAHPEEPGIHYSDLFERYLPVQDKPRRLLADWLPEYFFRTPDGKWRPPSNDEERAQKEALRTGGTLRRIKRFARALSEGVPPHDRDRPTNVATAADWIRQCRRAGLYEIGRVLYEKGGLDFQQLDEIGTMEVEEDYQVCVRRSG